VYKLVMIICLAVWAFDMSFVVAQSRKFDGSKTVQVTVEGVKQLELRHFVFDADFCQRWVDRFIEFYDPSHRYFIESDIDEFHTYLDKLPDMAASGDLELCHLVTSRYQRRVDAVMRAAIERLDNDFDFTGDDDYVFPGDSWPNSLEQQRKFWDAQVKYDLLVEKSGGSTIEQAKEFVRGRYQSIRAQATELSEEQIVGNYLDSFCRASDPHSGFYTRQEFTGFGGGMLQEYSIGLQLRVKNGFFQVTGLAEGYDCNVSKNRLLGCQILAITEDSGTSHHLCELCRFDYGSHFRYGNADPRHVKLELYHETRLDRFTVTVQRKPIK
jgi:carboxyl-terminal processing protease